MKPSYKILIVLFILPFIGWAQAPEGMNYQAVARDAVGEPLANQAITVVFEIRQGSTTGPSLYSETQSVSTNQFGLFTVQIGAGTVISGTFNTIAWGANSYYLYVEIDGDPMGSSQLLSVPYALYAKQSANGPTGPQGPAGISINWLGTFAAAPGTPNLNDAYYDSTLGQSFVWDGTNWNIIAQDGTAGSFTAGPGISIISGVISNIGDLDSLNELQTITRSGGMITLSDGGGSVIDSVIDADADPNNERITTFALNGTNDSLIIVEAGVGHAFPLSNLNDGDWLRGTGNDIYNNTDSVGIGTTNPATTFHVFNGSGLGGGAYNPIIDAVVEDNDFAYIEFNAGNFAGMTFNDDANSIRAGMMFDYNLDALMFRTGGVDHRMTLSEAGRLGIGTNTPADMIHISGGAPGTRIRVENTTNGWAGLVGKNILGEMFVGVQGAFDPNPGEFHIFDNVSNAQRMVIDAGGNVGFGNPNPEMNVHIEGNGLMINAAGASNKIGGIAFRNGYTVMARPFHLGMVSYDLGYSSAGFSDGLVISGFDGIAFTTNNSALSNTTLTNVRMVIDNSGRVGIGTQTPAQTLDVAGRMNATSGTFGTSALQFGANAEFGGRINIINSTATNRVFVGESGSNYVELSWNTASDYGHVFTNNGPLVLNNGSQNVGIGTISPISKLHVSFAGTNYPTIESTSANSPYGMRFLSGSRQFLFLLNPGFTNGDFFTL